MESAMCLVLIFHPSRQWGRWGDDPSGASFGVSRQNIRRKIKCWMDNQHLTRWQGPSSTQRKDPELISGPSPAANARLLFFNKTQARVNGLLTGHNNLRRHLHLMGLNNSPLRRKCGAEDETSALILCVRACVCARVRVCVCVCLYTYIYIYIYLWLHSDMYIWAPFPWIQRTSRV